MVQRSIERLKLIQRDQSEKRPTHQSKVLRPAGFAPWTMVFAPTSGVAFPMVLVLHRPVPADDSSELGSALLLALQARDEDAAFRLERPGLAALPSARQADELASLGEVADVLLHIDAPQVALFDAAVLAFHLAAPFGWLLTELLHPKAAPGILVEGFLVSLEPYEVAPAATEDDVRRFF